MIPGAAAVVTQQPEQPEQPKPAQPEGEAAAAGGKGGKKGWGGWAGGWQLWGKGGGKGWKGNWAPPNPSKVQTVPADFEIDSEARHQGTVTFYNKWKGFGFITLKEEGVVPNNTVFVQWRAIQSTDRFPFLVKDMDIELSIMKWREQSFWGAGGTTLRAKNVTQVGGGAVSVQDEIDGEKKEFVGGQDLRYTGTLKFYNPRIGFGYIAIDAGFQLEEGVGTELRVERSEVNAGGRQPSWMSNIQVEFGIWKTQKGAYKAYNMTLPGGMPLTMAALENRMVMGPEEYKGTVEIWNWRQGWGFIKVAPGVPLPSNVQAKLSQQTQAAQEKAQTRGKTNTAQDELIYFRRMDVKPGARLRKDQNVTFHIYTDDKGVGAMEITALD